MTQENTHWINRIVTGTKDKLDTFQKKYDEVSTGEKMFVTASNLFPIMDEGTSTGRYDWIIYYKIHPDVLKDMKGEPTDKKEKQTEKKSVEKRATEEGIVMPDI